MRRILAFATIVALIVCGVKSPAVAEILPRKGTFEGTYHRDAWGVGRFDYFLVHPDLHQQLAEYEGKRVQLIVENANQTMNPGPAIITDIGAIVELDPLPLQLTVETVPNSIQAGQRFQVVVRVVNRGDTPLIVRNTDVTIRNRTTRAVPTPDARDFFMPEYTRGQRSVTEQSFQMYDELAKQSVWGYARLSHAISFEVKPCERFPLVVLYRDGLPRGVHEFEASCYVRSPGVDPSPKAIVWHRLEVGERETPSTSEEVALQITAARVDTSNEGYEASIAIAHSAKEQWQVVKSGDGKNRGYFGYLEAYDREGGSVPLVVKDAHSGQSHPEPWQFTDVNEDGIRLTIQFRHGTLFAPSGIKRLVLRLLTQNGLDTFTVVDDFDDLHVPESTPFGDPIDGVQLRIRPDQPILTSGELKFHLQALNVGGEPILWRMPKNRMGDNVIIEIDGEAIAPTKTSAEIHRGWAGKNTCGTPCEWTITLPLEVKLPAGVHIIRYTIDSRGGTYQNAHHDEVPILRGRLSSAQVLFRVK